MLLYLYWLLKAHVSQVEKYKRSSLNFFNWEAMIQFNTSETHHYCVIGNKWQVNQVLLTQLIIWCLVCGRHKALLNKTVTHILPAVRLEQRSKNEWRKDITALESEHTHRIHWHFRTRVNWLANTTQERNLRR